MPHGLVGGHGWPIVNGDGARSEQLPPVCIYTLLSGSLLLKKPEETTGPFHTVPFQTKAGVMS